MRDGLSSRQTQCRFPFIDKMYCTMDCFEDFQSLPLRKPSSYRYLLYMVIKGCLVSIVRTVVVSIAGCGGDQHCGDFTYNSGNCVCDRLLLFKAASLQPNDRCVKINPPSTLQIFEFYLITKLSLHSNHPLR